LRRLAPLRALTRRTRISYTDSEHGFVSIHFAHRRFSQRLPSPMRRYHPAARCISWPPPPTLLNPVPLR